MIRYILIGVLMFLAGNAAQSQTTSKPIFDTCYDYFNGVPCFTVRIANKLISESDNNGEKWKTTQAIKGAYRKGFLFWFTNYYPEWKPFKFNGLPLEEFLKNQ